MKKPYQPQTFKKEFINALDKLFNLLIFKLGLIIYLDSILDIAKKSFIFIQALTQKYLKFLLDKRDIFLIFYFIRMFLSLKQGCFF